MGLGFKGSVYGSMAIVTAQAAQQAALRELPEEYGVVLAARGEQRA